MDEAVSGAPGARIAGFWRRLAALVIDSIVGGVAGWLLGLPFFDTLVQLGPWGRAIGFVVAVAYFGVLNSRIGGGQTLGKMAMGIEVIGRDGEHLPLPRSLARAAVLCVPVFLNGASFPPGVLMSFWIFPLSVLVFGGFGAIVYLYLFNRRTRQSLHDLAVDSYVVRHETFESWSFPPVWRTHLIVAAALAVASAGVPIATGALAQMPVFQNLITAYQEIVRLPHVRSALVTANVSSWNDAPARHEVRVIMSLDKPMLEDKRLAERAARIVLARVPDAKDKHAIRVDLVYGYDIGFMSSSRTYRYVFDPHELVAASADKP